MRMKIVLGWLLGLSVLTAPSTFFGVRYRLVADRLIRRGDEAHLPDFDGVFAGFDFWLSILVSLVSAPLIWLVTRRHTRLPYPGRRLAVRYSDQALRAAHRWRMAGGAAIFLGAILMLTRLFQAEWEALLNLLSHWEGYFWLLHITVAIAWLAVLRAAFIERARQAPDNLGTSG